MKNWIIFLLVGLLLWGLVVNEWTYRNTYRVSESSMRIDWLGNDWKGVRSFVHFFTQGDSATLSFKDINKLRNFSVNCLNDKGELINEIY